MIAGHLIKQAVLGEFDGLNKEESERISIVILTAYPDGIPPLVVKALRRISEKSTSEDSNE